MLRHHRTDYEVLESASGENRRLLRQEGLLLEITEALSEALLSEGITKTQLAERLGKTKGFVSQVLGGGRNLTLRTVADIADALNCRVSIHLEPVGREGVSLDVLHPGPATVCVSSTTWHPQQAPQIREVKKSGTKYVLAEAAA